MRRFVADASHELRTPLTSVRGLADFYFQRGEAASRAEVTRMMTGIQQEAPRMARAAPQPSAASQPATSPWLAARRVVG